MKAKHKNKTSAIVPVTPETPLVIKLTLEGNDEVLSLLKRLNISSQIVNDHDNEYGTVVHECYEMWAVLRGAAAGRGVL